MSTALTPRSRNARRSAAMSAVLPENSRRSPPFAEKFAALGIGVARDLEVWQQDVVGQGQIIVAHRLAFLRDPGHDRRLRHRAADRQVEANLGGDVF